MWVLFLIERMKYTYFLTDKYNENTLKVVHWANLEDDKKSQGYKKKLAKVRECL